MGEHPSAVGARGRDLSLLARVALGFAALIWLVLRSGRKPGRLLYPCQQAALGTASATLAPAFGSAVIAFATALGPARRRGSAAAALSLLVLTGGLFISDHSRVAAGGPGTPLPAAEYTARIYVVDDAGGPIGEHHGGVDALIACMAGGGLKLYRSPATRPESGPDGIVGAADVVLVKVNSQWPERGGTNTDVLKGLVARVLEHPDGFTGEIVVVENTQAMGTLDWPNANAEDHSQSALDVVNHFAGLGRPVSAWLWDTVRSTAVAEYSAGDLRDGYVVGPWDPETQIRVSYPKFRTTGGAYVSLAHGIWDPGTGSYADSLLTFLNLPVLKCHGAVYGVTACVKHHVGTMTTALSANTHNAVRYGGLGTFLAEVRMPDLNLLDAMYILARPSGGPWCTYGEATAARVLLAGLDPIAIDLWATRNILVPAILANGYTSYPMQDPDDPQSIFRRYLDLSMNELIAAGIQVTNDPARIEASVCEGAGIDPPEGPEVPAPAGPLPNPAPHGSAIRFEVPPGSPVELSIYDPTGRLRRTIRGRPAAGTERAIAWDGRDEAGRLLPAGTYAYRLRVGAAITAGKVTLGN